MNSESFLESSDVRWDTTQRRPSRIRGEFTLPAADSPDSAILALLSQHADELQLPHPVEESLRVVDTQDTPTARVVRFEQQYQGIPVLDTEVVAVLDNDQRVTQLDLAFEKRAQPAQAGDEKVEPDQALRTTIDSLGAPTLRGEAPTPSEVYYPAPDGLRLAYLVLVPTQEPPHDWREISYSACPTGRVSSSIPIRW